MELEVVHWVGTVHQEVEALSQFTTCKEGTTPLVYDVQMTLILKRDGDEERECNKTFLICLEQDREQDEILTTKEGG